MLTTSHPWKPSRNRCVCIASHLLLNLCLQIPFYFVLLLQMSDENVLEKQHAQALDVEVTALRQEVTRHETEKRALREHRVSTVLLC